MNAKSKAQQYQGLDAHIHVTVSKAQRAKLQDVAKRTGCSLSVLVRGMIDGLEVGK